MYHAFKDPETGGTFGSFEVFYADDLKSEDGEALPAGFYWWACFPGCMPDGDPFGPFETEADAIAEANEES
jgi:hypothetical protein